MHHPPPPPPSPSEPYGHIPLPSVPQWPPGWDAFARNDQNEWCEEVFPGPACMCAQSVYMCVCMCKCVFSREEQFGQGVCVCEWERDRPECIRGRLGVG